MTNEGESKDDGMIHDQLESEFKSEDVDAEESVVIPEVWPVYSGAVSGRHSYYRSRFNQQEWDVTRNDRCRSNL